MDLRPKVLILDDDRLSLELYSRDLARDYQVATSTSVDDTRRLLRELSPTILILEPAVNQDEGWELLSEIKISPNPPLLILCSVEDDRQAGLQQGAYAYLVKPVLPATLHNLVNQIVAKSPPHSIERLDKGA